MSITYWSVPCDEDSSDGSDFIGGRGLELLKPCFKACFICSDSVEKETNHTSE